MDPNKSNTFSFHRAMDLLPTTPATIRNPQKSSGNTQKRCFSCDAYDECLEVACGVDDEHWITGFDCSRCPSAVKMDEIPMVSLPVDAVTQRRIGAMPLPLFAALFSEMTRHGGMGAADIGIAMGRSRGFAGPRLARMKEQGTAAWEIGPRSPKGGPHSKLWHFVG